MPGPRDKHGSPPPGWHGPRKRRGKPETSTTRRASTPNSKKPHRGESRKSGGKKRESARSPAHPPETALAEVLGTPRSGRRPPTESELDPLSMPPDSGGTEGPLFTRSRCDAVLRLIQDGAAQAYAAHVVGVSRRSLQEWLRRGRSRRDAHESWQRRVDEGETVGEVMIDLGCQPGLDDFAAFAQLYEKAEATSILSIAQCIIDRALARDGFVLGGTETVTEESGSGNDRVVTRTSTTVRNGTIECAQWWLERRDNRMFGKGALRPMPDDERDEHGKRIDPVGALFDHITRFFDNAPDVEKPDEKPDEKPED